MKTLLVVASIFMFTTIHAQDPMLQVDHPKLEKEAFDITREYNKELALDGDQILLFQKKVEEFLIRRQNLENKYSGKDKLTALLKMQLRETAEMGDILTQHQMDVYKKIKPDIQPIDVVETDN